MSDIFNESSNKQDIISLLSPVREEGRDNISAKMENYIIPNQSKVVPDNMKKFTSNELVIHAMKLDIPVYKPRTIPENTSVLISGKINPFLLEVQSGQENISDIYRSLPFGQQERIPKYVPSYKSIPNNLKLYKQIWFQYLKLNIETRTVYSSIMQKLYITMRDTSMCAGTWQGQLHRLQAGRDGKMGLKGFNKTKDLTESLGHLCRDGQTVNEKYSEIMEEYMPINLSTRHKEDELVNFPGLFKRPSFFAGVALIPNVDAPGGESEEIWSFLPRIGTDKMAGPPFPYRYKDQVIIESYALADTFMGTISQNLAKSYNRSTSTMNKPTSKTPDALKDMQETMQRFWYLGASYMFPKMERYDWQKVLKGEKTRNIFAQPYPTFIIQSMIMDPVLDYAPNFLIDDRIPSMYGVSFYHGGMDKTISLLTQKGRTITLVYADNLYISKWNEGPKCHSFYSVDLVKGESQTTPRDLSAMNYYLLTRGHINIHNMPKFNMTWAYTGTNLLPHMQADCAAILGSIQFKVPGMASGIKITYCGNAGRSSIFAYHWRRGVNYLGLNIEPECEPDSDSWKALSKFVGINWLVEQTINNLEEALLDCKNSAPKTGMMQEQGSDQTKHLGKVVELDLLGYAATYSNLMEAWIPVLSTDRLIAALVAPQRDSERPVSVDANNINVALKHGISNDMYKLVMAETYRMAGGWFYQPIDEALKVMANDARDKLEREGLIADAPFLAALKLTEFADQLTPEDIKDILPRGVTSTDLINVNTPKIIVQGSRTQLKHQYYEEFKDVNERRKETSTSTFNTNKIWNNRISTLLLTKIEDWAKSKYLIDLKEPNVEVSEAVIADMKNNNLYREALSEFYSISAFMGSNGEEATIKPKTFKMKNVTPEEIANPAGVKGNTVKASNITASTTHMLSGQRKITNEKVLKPVVGTASFLSETKLISDKPINYIKPKGGILVKMTPEKALADDIYRLGITKEQLELIERYQIANEEEKIYLRQTTSVEPQAFKSFENIFSDGRSKSDREINNRITKLQQTYGKSIQVMLSKHNNPPEFKRYRKEMINMHYMYTHGETSAARELEVAGHDTSTLGNAKIASRVAQDAVRKLDRSHDQVKKATKDHALPLLPLAKVQDMAIQDTEAFIDYYSKIGSSELLWAKNYFKTLKKALGEQYIAALHTQRSGEAKKS